MLWSPSVRKEVTLRLNTKDINALARQVKRLANRMKETGSESFPQKVHEELSERALDTLTKNVFEIPFRDGNDDSYGVSMLLLPPMTTKVIWRGSQIAYLEFGTGAKGAGTPYMRPDYMHRFNYHPDPTKEMWVYLRGGESILSTGIAPIAPLYRTSKELDLARIARPMMMKELNSVFNS